MSDFLCEMHFHTEESSSCGQVPAAQGVRLYIERGYDGIVVTDHFQMYRVNTEQEYIDYVAQQKIGYERAVQAAAGKIKIFRGMEYRPKNTENDFLVYGVTDDFLLEHTELRSINFEQFSKLCRENGLAVFQAHPFRNYMTVTKPDLLDGIEVYNGNPRHDSRNLIAGSWSKLHALRAISGSDFHQLEDLAHGGTYFQTALADEKHLIAELLCGTYGIKCSALPEKP